MICPMTSALSVGVQLPEIEREVGWPERVAMARAIEAAGLDSLWVGDHLLHRGIGGRPESGPWEAWTQLGALAAVTERVTLGPLVACLGFHPPAVLAKMAATIDAISGGRLVLGVGAGWSQAEFEAFGLPFDRRVSRYEEALSIVRTLLAGERVTLRGRFWSADDAVLLPAPERRVPLMSGSTGPRALRITLPHADAWNTWWEDYGNAPDGFAALNDRISAACTDVGREPSTLRRSACVLVTVGGGAGERPALAHAPAVAHERLPDHLGALAAAGADEAILVLDPITQGSIAAVAEALGR